MKPGKVRNQQIYRATNQVRNKQLGASLSKQLRQKYGRRHIRVLDGDVVKVTRGEYKGINGKVTKISLDGRVAIEGIKKEKIKGDKVDILIHTSNLLITSLKTDDKWRTKILEAKAKPTKAKAKPTKAKAKPTEAKAKPTEAKAKPTEAKAKPTEAKAKTKSSDKKEDEK